MPTPAPVGTAKLVTGSPAVTPAAEPQAKPAPKRSPKKAATRPAKKTLPAGPTPEASVLVDAELKRQTEFIVMADSLLFRVERRHPAVIDRSTLRTTHQERAVFRQAFELEANDAEGLALLLNQKRFIRQQLEAGVSRAAVINAEAKLSEATKAADQHAEAAASIDVEALGKGLASRLQELREQHDANVAAREEDEADLRRLRTQYGQLLEMAPAVLCERIEQAVYEFKHGAECEEFRDLEVQLALAKAIVKHGVPADDYLRDYGFGRSRDRFMAIVNLFGEDALDHDVNGQTILNRPLLIRAIGEASESLPGLESQLEAASEAREAGIERCREPLHKWAETGVLTTELLEAE